MEETSCCVGGKILEDFFPGWPVDEAMLVMKPRGFWFPLFGVRGIQPLVAVAAPFVFASMGGFHFLFRLVLGAFLLGLVVEKA
jgi:hypothetical protein